MKRLICILLTLCMAVSICCVSASASVDPPFSDVLFSDWAYTEINWAFGKGLVSGTSATTFSPNDKTLRGQMTAILYRYAGEPAVSGASSFSDIKSSAYYASAVCWAQKNNILISTVSGSDKFLGGTPISRAEFCAMIYNYAGYKGVDRKTASAAPFSDVKGLSSELRTAINWAYANGIVNGVDKTHFSPNSTLTRAQAVVMLYRYESKFAFGGSTTKTYVGDEVTSLYDVKAVGTLGSYFEVNVPVGQKSYFKISDKSGAPVALDVSTDGDDPDICSISITGLESDTVAIEGHETGRMFAYVGESGVSNSKLSTVVINVGGSASSVSVTTLSGIPDNPDKNIVINPGGTPVEIPAKPDGTTKTYTGVDTGFNDIAAGVIGSYVEVSVGAEGGVVIFTVLDRSGKKIPVEIKDPNGEQCYTNEIGGVSIEPNGDVEIKGYICGMMVVYLHAKGDDSVLTPLVITVGAQYSSHSIAVTTPNGIPTADSFLMDTGFPTKPNGTTKVYTGTDVYATPSSMVKAAGIIGSYFEVNVPVGQRVCFRVLDESGNRLLMDVKDSNGFYNHETDIGGIGSDIDASTVVVEGYKAGTMAVKLFESGEPYGPISPVVIHVGGSTPSISITTPDGTSTDPGTANPGGTTNPGSTTNPSNLGGETVSEPQTPSDSDYISDVIDLVNQERAKEGLAALQTNDAIAEAARVRAKELLTLFEHTRPDGRSCFTALDEAGVRYYTAGENIAMGYSSPESVVKGWMNSPGHRANILNGSFTTIGVGYDSSKRCWVQLFTA